MKSDTDSGPGVCASDAPAIVVRDGEPHLAGSDRTLEDAVAALARGEDPGLTAAQRELAEAAFDRDPGLAG